jgi:polyhydroxybutyrate depolymerase
MRIRKSRLGLLLLGILISFLTAAVYFGYAPPPKQPKLSGTIQHSGIRVGNYDRSYSFYVPRKLPTNSPIVFILHGSFQQAKEIRIATGYEFERLADENMFVLVYPEGYEKNWNDCRKLAKFPAKILGMDDLGFIRALIMKFHRQFGADVNQVFAAGYSNGGHMAYRLAVELPDEILAIAAISASLPTADNFDCRESGRPIPVLIMNGTNDPLSPYNGGNVSLYGFGSRGTVRSSTETAKYFARLAGLTQSPDTTETLPHQSSSDSTSVKKEIWISPWKPQIILYSIINGGHLIPQPGYRPPRMLGQSTSAINGPAEIWNFFASHRIR